MQDIFVFERTGLRPDGKVCGRFSATGIRPKCSDRLAQSGCRCRQHVRTHQDRGLRIDVVVRVTFAFCRCDERARAGTGSSSSSGGVRATNSDAAPATRRRRSRGRPRRRCSSKARPPLSTLSARARAGVRALRRCRSSDREAGRTSGSSRVVGQIVLGLAFSRRSGLHRQQLTHHLLWESLRACCWV